MKRERASGQNTIQDAQPDVSLVTVYEQWKQPIFAYAYRVLGSQEDAEDVTQEVFLRLHAHWHRLTEHDRLSSWLYKLASNLCIDQLRKRKRFGWHSLSQFFQQAKSVFAQERREMLPEDTGGILAIEERELILLAMNQLPPDLAIALVLSSVQGLTYHEIADIMAIQPQAAATRIFRAKKRFHTAYLTLSRERHPGRKEKS